MVDLSVLHTIASLDPRHGGPSRSVPALVLALQNLAVRAELRVPDPDAAQGLEGIDVCHDHGLWRRANRQIATAARRGGIPRVVSPRGMLEPWALARKRLKKRAAWFLYQRRDLQAAAAIHVTSEEEAASVRRVGVTAPIAVIPNGIELPDPMSAVKRRNEVLFLSRIHPKKGIPNLLAAWAALSPEDWVLRIVGPGDPGYIAELQDRANQLALNGSVVFSEPATDEGKWSLYSSARLFVLPTHSENFGLVVAEALAAGTPVITTHGAPWRHLEENDCGWWIEIGADPLAAALGKAMSTPPAVLEEMGERGRSLVADRFAWSHVATNMRRLYEWLLGTGPRPEFVSE